MGSLRRVAGMEQQVYLHSHFIGIRVGYGHFVGLGIYIKFNFKDVKVKKGV